MKNSANNIFISTCLIFLASILYISFVPSQSDFVKIIIPYTLAFVCYWYFTLSSSKKQLKYLIALGVLTRFILIFSFPNLSDDIYRFIWDGRLLHQNINPYSVLPIDIVNSSRGLSENLLNNLNSPEYYTIYPPISQLVNYLSTFHITDNYVFETITFKSLLFLSDVLLLPILVSLTRTLQLPLSVIVLYYLNPLIIIETMGNCHFEGVMIFFFAITLLTLSKNQFGRSALSFASSIASKMLTLMFSPAIFNYIQGNKQKAKYTLYTAMSAVFLFAPIIYFMSLYGGNIASSLDLYLKKFEFNGGIYYALRYLGYKIYGFNMIHVLGPLLSFITLISILYISFRKKPKTIQELMIPFLFSYVIFILLSRTVHPWYLSLALFLSIFTQYRFTLLWTYLIGWTYINYSYPEYTENMLIVSVEYICILAYMYYELRIKSTPGIAEATH